MKATMTVNSEGAKAKTRALKSLDIAAYTSASRWAAQTVKVIKQGLRGRFLHKKTGKLARVVGMSVQSAGTQQTISIGTNVGKVKDDVVYARIHEEGGWIFPRNKRALTIPLPGIKGRVSDFGTFGPGGNLFVIKSKKHGLGIIAERRTGKTGRTNWRPLFVLRTSVKMPARHWFSIPIAEQQPDLKMMMSSDYIYAEATRLAAKTRERAAIVEAKAVKATYMGGD